jgi:hypothetical protein
MPIVLSSGEESGVVSDAANQSSSSSWSSNMRALLRDPLHLFQSSNTSYTNNTNTSNTTTTNNDNSSSSSTGSSNESREEENS